MLVYVLKQNGQPFMPTVRFGKIRRLLKTKKAKVVRREPFTIKLLYEYFIKGRASSGFAVLMNVFGNKIDFSNMPRGMKTPKLSNCKRLSARKSCLCIIRKERAIHVP